ncbi:MAG: hypothetical protein COB09_07930 [Thalassobium sp.]|nr:MAG: hypothetical protein COB09_07930 [Thalassobium sp.]
MNRWSLIRNNQHFVASTDFAGQIKCNIRLVIQALFMPTAGTAVNTAMYFDWHKLPFIIIFP